MQKLPFLFYLVNITLHNLKNAVITGVFRLGKTAESEQILQTLNKTQGIIKVLSEIAVTKNVGIR